MQNYYYRECETKEALAMAYVHWQNMEKLFEDLDKALCIGTIFPELDKPFTGRRTKS